VNLIDQLLKQVELKGDTDRQDAQEKRLNMYLDDFGVEVDTLLSQQFHPKNRDRLYPMRATYLNIFKKIVNLKSVIYRQSAVRQWVDRKDNDDKNYSDLIKRSNIDRIMQTVNKLTNTNNNSFVRIIPSIKLKKIMYEAVPSENISIIQDPENPAEILALLHRVTIKDSSQEVRSIMDIANINRVNDKFTVKYFYWDKNNYFVLDNEKNIIKNEKNPDNKNPYIDPETGEGIIPYEFFTSFEIVAGNIWNETVNQDLYDATLQINVFQTYFHNLLKQSGYNQLVFLGLSNDEIKKLDNSVSDALQPLAFNGVDAKVDQVKLSAELKDMRDSIHDIISEVADNHGIEFSSRVSSAQKMSGDAMRLSKEALDNIKEEQIPLYRDSEKNLARKTVIISNTDLKTNIDIEGKFEINFYEEDEIQNIDERIKWNDHRLRYNLASVIDIYREIDRDVENDDIAKMRIEENADINNTYRDLFSFDVEGENAETNQES